MATTFDPYAILQALERQRVIYLVVGGLGRVLQGSDELTGGIDIVPSMREENLGLLEAALEDLGCPTRGREAAGARAGSCPRAGARARDRRRRVEAGAGAGGYQGV